MALINNPEGKAKLIKSYSTKATVCCATCYNDCTPEKHAECYTETTAFLWWSEKLGYHPKLHEKLSYTCWIPVPDVGFITKREMTI